MTGSASRRVSRWSMGLNAVRVRSFDFPSSTGRHGVCTQATETERLHPASGGMRGRSVD